MCRTYKSELILTSSEEKGEDFETFNTRSNLLIVGCRIRKDETRYRIIYQTSYCKSVHSVNVSSDTKS